MHILRLLLSIIILSFSIFSYSYGYNNEEKIKLIIDIDPANFTEDLMMLQLALNSDELKILAVVSTNSFYSSDKYVESRIILKFLDLADRKDIPVARGLKTKGNDALFDILKMSANEYWAKDYSLTRLSDKTACELIIDILNKEKDVTLLTTGPMTNLACVLANGGKAVNNIKKIYIMGCAFESVLEPIEYNVASDIKAAKVVLNSSKDIVIVPSDATWELILWQRYYEQLKNNNNVCKALYKLNEEQQIIWGKGHKYQNLPVMFDSFALATVINENIGFYSYENVFVEDNGSTLFDKRGQLRKVYYKADKKAFYDFFMNRICK